MRTGPSRLSHQEREALSLLARGYTYTAISEDLEVSDRTVRRVLERAAKKLGATNPINAVSIASYHRLIGTAYLPSTESPR